MGRRMQRVEDEIDFDVRTFRYANIAESLHRGIEGGVWYGGSGPLSGSVSWAWSRVESLERRGRQLKNVPEHLGRASLTVTRLLPVDLTLAAEYLSGIYYDDENLFGADDATRLDLRITHDLQRIRLVADIENVFDPDIAPAGLVLRDFLGAPAPLQPW